MQRILSFGRLYGESAEFSVDEGESISFTLVREDRTTTVGEAEAELWRKSAVGNDHWTTIAVLNDAQPSYEMHGTDERMIYKWVRKAGERSFAIDRRVDAALSRTLRAPVDPRQLDFNAATPVIFKALAETSGDFVGFHYDFQNDGVGTFGNIVGGLPGLQPGATDSYIKVYRDTDTDTLEVEFFDNSGSIDWSEYEDGQLGIASECFNGTMLDTSVLIPALDVGEDGFVISVPSLGLDDTMEGLIAEEKTFFVFLMKPGQTYPVINLGARTGQFSLDQNDIPARLSAWPFDTDDENVTLSIVEGSVVIPMIEDGIRRALDVAGTTTLLEGPGAYQWERSCNSAPGIYLNTGWRA